MTTWELVFVIVAFFACLVNIALLYISERKHEEAVDRYFEAVLRYETAVKMERLQCAVMERHNSWNARRGEEE
tara:strand:- start:81 stop:299 length:219 start_codon:yes stop_codon:yes gene_type:complete